MKAILTVLLCFSLAACGRLSNVSKHLHSYLTGLDRKITLYDASGKSIREWRTRAQIEDQGGTIYFIADGRAVTISGTFIVEEQ